MGILVAISKSPKKMLTAAICGRRQLQQTPQNRDAVQVMRHMLQNHVWNLMKSRRALGIQCVIGSVEETLIVRTRRMNLKWIQDVAWRHLIRMKEFGRTHAQITGMG